MKVIVDKPVGGDGADVMLDVSAGNLELKVTFPVTKIVDPIMKLMDPLKSKLEALIPGNWADPLVEAAFSGLEAEIVKVLSE